MSSPTDALPARPASTSARLAGGIGIACVAGLLWRVQSFLVFIGVAVLGISCLGVAVWLLRQSSPDPVNHFLASLLAVPATLGVLAGGAGMVVALLGSLFPVPTGAGIPTAALRIVSNLGIVLGCLIAVLGLATTTRNVLEPAPLSRFTRSALICATVPLGVGAALAGTAVLFLSGTASESLLSQGLSATLSPDSDNLHLGTFLFTLAAASGSLWLLGTVVPYRDALADVGFGPSERTRVGRAQTLAAVVAAVTGLLFLPVTLAEAFSSPTELRRTIGPGVFDFVQAVTTLTLLRDVLIATAVVSIVAMLVVTAARVVAGRTSTTAGWMIPATAGTAVTVVAGFLAADIYEWVVTETATRLPAGVASAFVDVTRSTRVTYGESTIIIVAVGVLTLLTAGLAYLIRIAISLGYVSAAGGGYSLASTGLLLGAVSAGGLESPLWLVFGCVVGALLVWDIGHYGVGVGQMIGPGRSRGAELVHAAVSVLVGAVAVVVAVGFRLFVGGGLFDPSPARVFALCALIGGLAALVVAARR